MRGLTPCHGLASGSTVVFNSLGRYGLTHRPEGYPHNHFAGLLSGHWLSASASPGTPGCALLKLPPHPHRTRRHLNRHAPASRRVRQHRHTPDTGP